MPHPLSNKRIQVSSLTQAGFPFVDFNSNFDNDMDLDIFSVCTISVKNTPNILYENKGDGTFIELPSAGGAIGSELGIGDSVTTVDYNGDGFLDLFVTNGLDLKPYSDDGPSQLFRNLGNDNHWIEIDLVGTISNRDGIGARIILTANDISQLREQTGGMHHASQNHKRLHFGLGNNIMIDSIAVYWPSGIAHEIKDLLVDQVIQIKEPSTPIPPRHQTGLGIDSSEILCKENQKLLLKSTNGNPACVKLDTWIRLLDRGWGINP